MGSLPSLSCNGQLHQSDSHGGHLSVRDERLLAAKAVDLHPRTSRLIPSEAPTSIPRLTDFRYFLYLISTCPHSVGGASSSSPPPPALHAACVPHLCSFAFIPPICNFFSSTSCTLIILTDPGTQLLVHQDTTPVL